MFSSYFLTERLGESVLASSFAPLVNDHPSFGFKWSLTEGGRKFLSMGGVSKIQPQL